MGRKEKLEHPFHSPHHPSVNDQRDVVFDGTMAWSPFVEATIAMVRDANHIYRRGPGYRPPPPSAPPGTPPTEVYWTVAGDAPPGRLPYRVEVVGVTCDPALAVARGVWRRLRSGRSVPARDQLRSHRLFATSFARVAPAADSATLFHTGGALTTLARPAADLAPTVVAHRSAATRGEMLVSPRAWAAFEKCARLNDGAVCAAALWPPGVDAPPPPLGSVGAACAAGAGTLLAVLRAADRRDVRRAERGG